MFSLPGEVTKRINAEVLPKQQIQGKPASLAMASSANATPLGGAGCGAFGGDYGEYGDYGDYGGCSGNAGGFPANGGMMVPPKMQFPKVAGLNGSIKCGGSRW